MEGNSGYGGGGGGGGNDVKLLCKTLQVEHKLLYFDLKENPRGRYLKISEKTLAMEYPPSTHNKIKKKFWSNSALPNLSPLLPSTNITSPIILPPAWLSSPSITDIYTTPLPSTPPFPSLTVTTQRHTTASSYRLLFLSFPKTPSSTTSFSHIHTNQTLQPTSSLSFWFLIFTFFFLVSNLEHLDQFTPKFHHH